jgi:hypothetical protein
LRGGLEITLLENGGTGWIAIHDNRVGHWTEAEIPGLMAALEA